MTNITCYQLSKWRDDSKINPLFYIYFFEKTKHSLNGFLLQLLGAGEFEKYLFRRAILMFLSRLDLELDHFSGNINKIESFTYQEQGKKHSFS